MPVINFTFKPESTLEQRQQALDFIKSMEEVSTAALLRPGAKNAKVQRMAFLRTQDSASLKPLVERITHLNSVETANIPAVRTLK